ncbi:carboxymuconolactone decarboxylase family protein [Petrotoga sp. 9PWA.NaAc.5.4]|uniref:(R)-mandelonitrile lyase n=1 Tax=Petrotoga sp. 9PWA.NaAc.5.4 TaxID=1434328 RepID=UPI000EFBD483|nr:carboxymuconolactone decarboxylase family protein [Petrotoga sp. 9PWA.NaAc.5.4]
MNSWKEQEDFITIIRNGSQEQFKGPQEWFTGDVIVKNLFSENALHTYSGSLVTFQAGARTAWHTHPIGQRLIITEGVGWVQQWGEPIEEVREGDVVWFPAGVKHWHGATPTSSMTHIALSGVFEGNVAEWMEKVSDEQYNKKNKKQALTVKQENIVSIAVFTTIGDLSKLGIALNNGLDSSLTINEIKEIIIQLYAYSGFPRSLNALTTFMEVLEDRKTKGIYDELGKEANSLPADKSNIELGTEIQTKLVGSPVSGKLYEFAPVMDEFLKGHLFGDIFGRGVLDYQTREMVTIGALASMDGVDSQLMSHYLMGLNAGLTQDQIIGIISVLEHEIGHEKAQNAYRLLNETLIDKNLI